MKLKRHIWEFFYRVRRVFSYLPLIWKNEDFDYAFFLEMTKFKFTRMRDYFESSKVLIDSDKESIVGDLNRCLVLLDRIIEEDYETDYLRELGLDMTSHDKFLAGEGEKYFVDYSKKRDEFLKNFKSRLTDSTEVGPKAFYDDINFLEKKDMEELTSILRDRMKFWWD